jgi:hypothetical protein
MKKLLIIILLMIHFSHAFAQNIPPFKYLRYDENYDFLKSDSSVNWYSKTKYLPLTKDRNTYASIGGDIRYQYFYFKNEGWGKSISGSDGYILNRILIHADIHSGSNFRAFLQLQSSLANDKIAPPSGVDENPLDLHQAFIDLKFPLLNQDNLIFRVGRQELFYGSQRIVSVREGPNNRQSFDGAKLMYARKNFKADFLYSHYVLSKQGIFDDGFNKNTKFWGAYSVVNNVPILKNIDFYYLGLWKNTALFDAGKDEELRHSVGTRVWNKSANWQYDFEGIYQWGSFGKSSISAFTISSNTTYTFSHLKLRPQINLKTEVISGNENYDSDKLNTFNPLFPRGAYFGLAALIGPANLMDFHPSFTISVSKKMDLSFDYDAFWRFSKNDGVYGPTGALIFSGKNVSDRFIGQQYSTFFNYSPNNFLAFRGEFTFFKAGDFFKVVSPGKDVLFTGITSQLKF